MTRLQGRDESLGLGSWPPMNYDIPLLLERHKACLDDIAAHFEQFFKGADYSKTMKGVKVKAVRSHRDLDEVLRGAGFYLVATDFPTGSNACELKIEHGLSIVYRGHSSNVRERIESHLFFDSYLAKDSGRRFTVCMKLDGKNINVDRSPLSDRRWFVVTHSMPKSTRLLREAAEIAFDNVFGRPIGSDK